MKNCKFEPDLLLNGWNIGPQSVVRVPKETKVETITWSVWQDWAILSSLQQIRLQK